MTGHETLSERLADIRWFPPLPLPLLQLALNRVLQQAVRNHPEIFERLGAQGDKTFLIDPVDLNFVLTLQPHAERPRLRAYRRWMKPAADARIAGKLDHLMHLVEGDMDGDSLFFNRDLTVEGDTAAVVTLRNALDNLRGNPFEEALKPCGPFKPLARQVIHHIRTRAA